MIHFIKIEYETKKQNYFKDINFSYNIFFFFFKINAYFIVSNEINREYINRKKELIKKDESPKNIIESQKMNISPKECYLFLDSSNIKIIHIIITRFLMLIFDKNRIQNKNTSKMELGLCKNI